jgi:hypothetical protein
MTPGLPFDVRRRIVALGAVSRMPVSTASLRPSRAPDPSSHVVLLQGRGGEPLTRRTPVELSRSSPGWRWTVLGGDGDWVEDPLAVLESADVVVTHAGLGSIADVAAARRPAVVLAEPRPHREQLTTAAALARGDWPAPVLPRFLEDGWGEILDRAASLDGHRWSPWCDGHAGERFAAVIDEHFLWHRLRHA